MKIHFRVKNFLKDWTPGKTWLVPAKEGDNSENSAWSTFPENFEGGLPQAYRYGGYDPDKQEITLLYRETPVFGKYQARDFKAIPDNLTGQYEYVK